MWYDHRMKIRLSSHGAYRHQYHVVWIPKYRQRILEGELKEFIEQRLFDIYQYHPDVEIEKYSIQNDHLHIVIVISPKYSVSSIIGKIKGNTSLNIGQHFKWIRKMYGLDAFSPATSPCMDRQKTLSVFVNIFFLLNTDEKVPTLWEIFFNILYN